MDYLKLKKKHIQGVFNPTELSRGIKEESEHTNNKAIQTQIAKDHLKEDPAYYSKLEKVMNTKEAYFNGFIKAAMEAGLTEGQACDAYKHAAEEEKNKEHKSESSGVGRWLAGKAQRLQNNLEHPFRAAAGALPAAALGGTLGGATFGPLAISHGSNAAALLGLQDMGRNYATQGIGKEKRENTLNEVANNLRTRSVGSNFHASGVPMAKLMALLGGLGGAVGMGAYALNTPHTKNIDTATDVLATLFGGAGGAGLGGLLGYGMGGVAGTVNKGLNAMTSKEDSERMAKMQAKHPILTSLPFGEMVGAHNA